MDLAFGGNLPQGAGLSSSAALEVATGIAAARSSLLDGRPRLARICQESRTSSSG